VWCKHSEPLIGMKRLSTFEPDDVATFYRKLLEKGVKRSQIAKCRVVLHRAFQVARLRRAYCGDNPFSLVDSPRYVAKERKSLTLTQAQALVKAAEESGDRLEAAVVLAIVSGMRLGEILGLKWSDIDLRKKSLSVRRSLQELNGRFTYSEGKSDNARRPIALGNLAVEALRRRKKIAEHIGSHDLVFCTAAGTPISRTNFRQRHFEPILKAAGAPKVRFHDLRHSFASLLLQRGTPVKVAAEALGHANPGITQRLYQHVLGDLQKDAIDEIDRALRPRKSRHHV
jgi:integrase